MTEEERKIVELRKKKLSYINICKELELKRDRVRYVCVKYGLGGAINNNDFNKPFKTREEEFADQFNKRFEGTFIYHSNFINTDEPFKFECLKCGMIDERNAQVLRKKDRGINCSNCKEKIIEVKKMIEDAQKELDERYKAITKKAIHEAKEDTKKKINKLFREMNAKEYSCFECGGKFKHTREKKYCSNKCSRKRNQRVKEIKRRKQLMKNGKVDYSISLEKLIIKHAGICALCGEPINKKDYTLTKDGHHISGNRYPSIDHIVPIARGGTHTWDNVQLAHRICNSLKGDSEINNKEGQLELML